MDLQKGIETESGKRIPIDVTKLKRNITDLITLNLKIVSELPTTYDVDDLEEGKDILKTTAEAMKPLSDMVSQIAKLEPDKWNKQKGIIRELAKVPLDTIKGAADTVDLIGVEKLNDVITNILPTVRGEIERLLELQLKLSNKLGSKKSEGNISFLAKDINSMILIAKRNVLSKRQINTLDLFVSFVERYADVADPFERFQKSFNKHVDDVGQLVKHINDIEIEKINEINNLGKMTVDIIDADTMDLATKLESIKEYILTLGNLSQGSNMMGMNTSSNYGLTNYMNSPVNAPEPKIVREEIDFENVQVFNSMNSKLGKIEKSILDLSTTLQDKMI